MEIQITDIYSFIKYTAAVLGSKKNLYGQNK